jgi:TM2 domain-containing membrane protein YozV
MGNVANPTTRKSAKAAYGWWLCLGGLGAHKFYLGRPTMGVVYILTFGLLSIGLLWDLFTLPAQVRAANARLGGAEEGQSPRRRRAFRERDEDDFDPAQADAMIARYLAAGPAPAASRAPAAAVARPSFGRRR